FRMIITFMIKKFSAGETNANEVKLKIPCLFLLDEFPVLGYFPDIALNAGILAGYGVTFFIVCQALNQIIDVYGENHPFLDHCKTIILYAPGSIKDARTFSESIGNRSVLLDNISASGSKFQVGFNNISRSSQETSTSLINPDELMKLEFSRAIIMNQGMPPYKGKKVVYYEDPRFKNKAFMKIPNIEWIMKQIKTLPSNAKTQKLLKEIVTVKKTEKKTDLPAQDLMFKTETVKPIEQAISEIEAIEVTRVIPAEFDVFAED
ncbi:MAG: type IV secretory system conjugative DNA transfer family protein, partial [Treponema sp.]|nr:type IV secretory system conjugative DNA transfer family protein [Treponema sp.]